MVPTSLHYHYPTSFPEYLPLFCTSGWRPPNPRYKKAEDAPGTYKFHKRWILSKWLLLEVCYFNKNALPDDSHLCKIELYLKSYGTSHFICINTTKLVGLSKKKLDAQLLFVLLTSIKVCWCDEKRKYNENCMFPSGQNNFNHLSVVGQKKPRCYKSWSMP